MTEKRTMAAIAKMAALACLWPAAAMAQPTGEFIWLSDVHFDPTADPSLVRTLAESDVKDWLRILDSTPGAYSSFGHDTNWALLSSSLDAIRKTAPEAQFTIITGDVFAHGFREKFESAMQVHDDESYRRFASKTMGFVAAQFATLAPGKPVFYTVGNNDGYCGDYQLQPNGPFLADSSVEMKVMLGRLGDEKSVHDWTALGSYSVPHPTAKRLRIISVDSVYFSPRYQNACGPAGAADPAKDEMQWLESQVAAAKKGREKVWLILHIPPGIDGYSTLHAGDGGKGKTDVSMWKPEYTEQFRGLLERYRKTIVVTFAGHEHTDDFRLLDHSLVLMTPGLSPLFDQSPAFRTVAFDRNGSILDETTYYLANLGSLVNGSRPDWKMEYRFASAWGVNGLNFRNVRKVDRKVEAEPAARDRWMGFYSVSHPEGNAITPQSFPWIICASGNATADGYDSCVAQLKPQSLH